MPHLRPASDSEKDAIFGFYEELFRPHVEQTWGWTDAWQRENFEEEWLASRTEVIESDGRIAGYLQTQDRADPQHLYLLTLGLIPEFQSRGIGATVLRLLMARATERNLPIFLNVFRTNPAAMRFYVRLGFGQGVPSNSGTILKWWPDRGTPPFS